MRLNFHRAVGNQTKLPVKLDLSASHGSSVHSASAPHHRAPPSHRFVCSHGNRWMTLTRLAFLCRPHAKLSQ